MGFGEPGEEAAIAGQGRGPGPHFRNELAVLEDLLGGQKLRFALDQVGKAQHDPRPLPGENARPTPVLERAPGGSDRLVDVLGAPFGNRAPVLLEKRVMRGKREAAFGREPLAVDMQAEPVARRTR